jgi:DNA-binding NtrC family response regulator
MSSVHILVVDDEEQVRGFLEVMLREEGYEVTAVADGHAALRVLRDTPVQIVLTDLMMPSMDGIEVVERVMELDAQAICLVMTGYATIERAVQVMKAGAFDFLTKPLQVDGVLVKLKKALEVQRLRQENLLLKRTVREKYRFENLIGTSEAMESVNRLIEKVADTDSTILITGESGTGKELVARLLHFNSARRDRALVPVNCGAIPETLLESELFGHERGAFTGATATRLGRFELAHGGTLFLDEVGEMSLALQVKLLRVLQERTFERVGGSKTIRVDVRIIAATNQDLEQLAQEKRFRKDLYYRLNVIPIVTPSLRERRSDVPLLADHFLTRFNESKKTHIDGIDSQVMAYLMQYDWPGNIRELENMIERLVILKKHGIITVEDLPDKILRAQPVMPREEDPISLTTGGVDLGKELEHFENRLIVEALRQANGVTSRAAQLLHVNRTTLVEKLKRKGLDAKGQVELYP